VPRQLDSWFEHYNTVHPHNGTTTTTAVGRVKVAAAAGGGAQRQP